jgi:hypothetical protein
MKTAVIALVLLCGSLTTLAAEQNLAECLAVESSINPSMAPTYAKYGDTEQCYLRVDGKVLVDGTCRTQHCGNTKCWRIVGAADVGLDPFVPGRPFYAHVWKHGVWVNYGRVQATDYQQEHICWGNHRFEMCFSPPYLICDPETIKAWTDQAREPSDNYNSEQADENQNSEQADENQREMQNFSDQNQNSAQMPDEKKP